MARFGKITEELPIKTEGTDSPGEKSDTGGSGKPRGKKESVNLKEYQKKKKDALEGKDSKTSKSSEADSSKGKRHGEPERQDSSDKSGKASGSGPQGQSSLQSGQTTVQFSSGGAAGSFGSLLALFASSATLVRAEGGSISIFSNQTVNLNLQNILRAINNQTGSLLGEEGRNIRYIGKAAEQVVESVGKQFSIEGGGNLVSNISNTFQDTFSAVLKGISAHATEGNQGPSEITKIPLFSINFTLTIYEGFNANIFFFPETTPFAFSNSPKTTHPILVDGVQILGADGEPAVALENTNPGIIDTYFSDAELGKPGAYTYEVISPIVTVGSEGVGQPVLPSHGLTVTKEGDLFVKIADAPEVVGTQNFGLTLTPKGDLYAYVLEPLSVLVKTIGGGEELVVRINVGPGEILANPNFGSDTLVGLRSGSGAFAPTVFKASGAYQIIGNGQLLNLGGFITDDYSFPSSTIFRHVGTSNDTAPQQAAYGNFAGVVRSSSDVPGRSIMDYSTFNLSDDHSYSLKLGGNVLDVFGTKYGEGDGLNLNLATNPSGPNSITMGGNTLAGFGKAIGDLETLNISTSGESHSSSALTGLTFNGNILWVDKSVDSILFPHLQNLGLSNKLTEGSNLNIIFKDSIIHGNLGADTFYGDVEVLGDLNDPLRYNGFITGVEVHESEDGHVVTTPSPRQVFVPESSTTDGQGHTTTIPAHYDAVPSTNFITWGNNIYHGGADPEHPSDKDINTYHFTLLGTSDPIPEPVMLGNALLTNFNPAVDTLIFQLTPALFRSLDINHDKTITVADLNSGAVFNPNGQFYNSLSYSTVSGTIISFNGGGSLKLAAQTLSGFGGILNLETEVNLTYIPIGNLPPDQITPTPPLPEGSYTSQPYIYGQGPNPQVHTYYNELDNFFDQSLFAHYTVSGLADPLTGLPINVTIDPYGSITVDSTVPYIIPLTITAINPENPEVDRETSDPLLFGFLNAPITPAAPGETTYLLTGGPNILIGGLDSKIVGGNQDNFNFLNPGGDLSNFNDTPTGQGSITKGSNLIVNTTASTTAEAYGNFKTILLSAQGTASAPGTVGNNAFNFKANAFYVNGTVLGVATSLTIEALGGNDSVIHFNEGANSPISLDVTGKFEKNVITTGSQIIYGNGVGTLTGIFKDIIITATPGTPKTEVTESANIQVGFDIPASANASSLIGSINTSSSIQHNTFNFGPTQITIIGDLPDQTSTIIGNAANLTITAESLHLKNISPTLTNITKATFEDNHFKFSDATIKSGVGNTIIFGHLVNFGDAYDHSHYGGFAKGVTVTYVNSHLTITDRNNNSITWGNNIYTAGPGADRYEYTLVQDAINKFPIMQGFDITQGFNLSEDTLVFNIARNLFESLGMNTFDSQTTLASKLDARGVLTSAVGNNVTIDFTGPLGSLVPYGKISLSNLINTGGYYIYSLASLEDISQYLWGRNSVIINVVGSDYVAPIFNATATSTFDPVFVKIDQPLAFVSFVTNADTDSLTWGVTGDTILPPEFSFTPDGTLHVFSTSDGKTPVDAFINVTVHDDIAPTDIITLPTIHIFALNSDQQVIRDARIQGSKATEIFETKQPGNTIVGGGANIIYNDTHPTVPATPLVYGSKLIYDISEGGHTAIGDVKSIQFTNTATTTTLAIEPGAHLIAALDGQIITFGANMFNINSGGLGVIYGNNQSIELTANAGRTSAGLLVDATINSNIFNFGSNTIYTVDSTTTHGPGDAFTVYGNLKTLNLSITNGSSTDMVGDAQIKGNEFIFKANKLFGSSDTVTLNPGIGTLTITNTDTSIHDPHTQNLTPISGNKFTFGDSILTSGTGHTYFNADIADLTNTAFASGIVAFRDNVALPVQITDSQNNVITWGNNTYKIIPDSLSSELTFTLLALGGNDAAMEGHAKIEGFRAYVDKLKLNLTYALFKEINTDFDRSVSESDLTDSNFAFFDTSVPDQTTVSFAPSLAAGSIVFTDKSFDNFDEIGLVTTALAYTPAKITVHNSVFNATPLVFVTDGGNGQGVYGNILDNYFDHIDIGDDGSTYEVTASASYHQLIDSLTLLDVTDTASSLFDEFGTARPAHISGNGPILSIINAKPNDVHFSENIVSKDIIIAAFNGTMTTDSNTTPGGTFIGSKFNPSYLQGKFAEEKLIGNADQISFSATNTELTYGGITYGSSKFGGNMIINTTTGNTAYGVARDILFSVETSGIGSQTDISGGFTFGPNALYVNGTVIGIADKFLMDARNTITGSFSASSLGTSFVNSYAHLANGAYHFGGQTIFGQGTLIGALNLFQISTYGNTTASITGDDPLVINAFTEVRENLFKFAPTEIIVLGSEHSTIMPHINSLSFFMKHGAFTQDHDLNQTLNAPAVIEKNTWAFQDSKAVGGAGGIDYYSDINDLSSTSFWTSNFMVFNTISDSGLLGNSNSHISMVDFPTIGFTNIGNNKIIGGNNTVYLSTEANSLDTIHLNVLRDSSGDVGLPGNLDVYNFNPTQDTIHFNLSLPLYKILNGGSTILNGSITAATLDSVVGVSSGSDMNIAFDWGHLNLHGVSGYGTLASLPNIQVGTTLVGNRDVSDGFTIGIPTDLSNFKEVDHIAQFNPASDYLRFVLTPTDYNQLGNYGLLNSADVKSAYLSRFSDEITITQKAAEYALADPTFTGANVDSTINFVDDGHISGSITLHNIDIHDLNSLPIQVGQQATAAADTFYFVVPGDDFSTFSGGTFITGFNPTQDNIEITVSKELYNAINPSGTASAASALNTNVPNGAIGGVVASYNGSGTDLIFLAGSSVGGLISLAGVATSLAGLGSHLHLGYIESGTTGVVDTFSFNLAGGSFDTFNQFVHLTNFTPTEDILQITVPLSLYNTINPEERLVVPLYMLL